MNTRGYAFMVLVISLISGMVGGVIVTDVAEPEVRDHITNHFNYEITDYAHNSTYYRQAYQNFMPSVAHINVHKVSDGVRTSSTGTGFVYDSEEGTVVTNQHVVEDGRDFEVKLQGEGWLEAEVVGEDRYSDLAVLELERVPDNLQELDVSDTNPDPGTVVVAMGSPLGLEGTITQGIVSGVNRTIRTEGRLIPDAVQTDASIDPGNSGGPMIGDDGTVVGVNTAKRGENIGFAVSPALVNRIVPELVEEGEYSHPYLGVNTRDMVPRIADYNNLDKAEGVIVTNVDSEGPSYNILQGSRASFRDRTVPVGGDVILEVDGHTVDSEQALNSFIVRNKSPGEEVELKVLRGGRLRTFEVVLDERPRGGSTVDISTRS